MTDTFQARIPALSDEELRQYLTRPLDYRAEAVEAALAELERRGHALPPEDLRQLREGLRRREALSDRPSVFDTLLGRDSERRRSRIRLITAGILALGLGGAALIYLTAPTEAANPLGYDPLDTKKYLRDLELYGGKVNVLATELMRWWDGLWRGRNLATTVAWLTLFTAAAFWFLAARHAAAQEDKEP